MDVEHGLQSFDVSEDALTEALDVFGGELTLFSVWNLINCALNSLMICTQVLSPRPSRRIALR